MVHITEIQENKQTYQVFFCMDKYDVPVVSKLVIVTQTGQ